MGFGTRLLWITPVSSREEHIRRALELAEPKTGETLYDLGSGHGKVLVMAAKEFGLNAVGIEVGPVQCAISWVNAFRNRVNSKVRIEAGNFYKSSLRDADIVLPSLRLTTGIVSRKN